MANNNMLVRRDICSFILQIEKMAEIEEMSLCSFNGKSMHGNIVVNYFLVSTRAIKKHFVNVTEMLNVEDIKRIKANAPEDFYNIAIMEVLDKAELSISAMSL